METHLASQAYFHGLYMEIFIDIYIYTYIHIFICLFILLLIFFPSSFTVIYLLASFPLFPCTFLNPFSLSFPPSPLRHFNAGIPIATLHRHAVCTPLSSISHAMPTAKVTRRLTPRQHQRQSTVTPTVPENALHYKS